MRYLIVLMWASPLFSVAQVYSNQTIPLGIEAVVSDNLYGAGVSFADFDMDGDDDLTFALDQEIVCYRNDGGVATEVIFPFDPADNAKHPVWVDFDNDGDRDFFVSCYMGTNKMYRNDGSGTFTDISETCGLCDVFSANWGSAWGDYDLDGDLDVYICSYVFAYDASDAYNYWDHLYRNNGDGTFTDVSLIAGIEDGISSTFQAIWMDYNNDLRPDLYVINDKHYANHLYQNNGDGTFTDIGFSAGASIASTDAMTASCADFNSDGYEDIFVTNTSLGPASLLKNNGNGTFTDIATTSGTALNILGWAGNWFDYDLDADQDLYVCEYFPQFSGLPNRFLRNNNNETFTSVQNSVFPLDFSNSYASATGDWNGDGFPDQAISNFSPQNAGVWISNGNSNNHWISIDPAGSVSNSDGIGARILVQTASTHEFRYTYLGENYIGQNSFTELFGVGQNSVVDTVMIQWPSGHVDVFTNLETEEHYVLQEGSGVQVQIQPVGAPHLCPDSSIVLDAGDFDSYLWNTGNTSRYLTVVDPGVYNVMVTTELGFVGYALYIVDPATMPEYSITSTPATCWEDTDGAILISPVTDELAVFWSLGSSSWELTNLSIGTYSGVLIMPDGCEHVFSVEVLAPQPFIPDFEIENPSCHLGDDGVIELISDNPDYFFSWSDGSPETFLSGLTSGVFEWTATNGVCIYSGEIVLYEPPVIGAGYAISDVSCFGLSDGNISEVIPAGGTPPYQIEFADLDTTALSAGTYSFFITDANGCTKELEFTISQPDLLEVSWQALCEDGLMSVFTNVTGGSFPYSYNWSTGASTASVSDIPDNAILMLLITDDHGCTVLSEGISCPVGVLETENPLPVIMPNPAKEFLNLESKVELGGWTIFDMQGRMVLSDMSKAFKYYISLANLSAGHYTLSVQWQDEVIQYKLVKEQ